MPLVGLGAREVVPWGWSRHRCRSGGPPSQDFYGKSYFLLRLQGDFALEANRPVALPPYF